MIQPQQGPSMLEMAMSMLGQLGGLSNQQAQTDKLNADTQATQAGIASQAALQPGQLQLQQANVGNTNAEALLRAAQQASLNQQASQSAQMLPGMLEGQTAENSLRNSAAQENQSKAALNRNALDQASKLFSMQQDQEQAKAALYHGHVLQYLTAPMQEAKTFNDPMMQQFIRTYAQKYMNIDPSMLQDMQSSVPKHIQDIYNKIK